MYLEGSDQHRGWFQSSLLESCGTRGRAPFDIVLTHGFTLDENGRKMSKSIGNTVEPQKVIAQSGADILRLWVCATDYADDQRIGPEILKNTIETYRKLRNSIRWMLGTLHHFRPGDAIDPNDMPELERLMLHQLAEQAAIVRQAYAEFDYKTVVASLSAFMNTELSAFYFDIRKDTLYCDPPSSIARKAALSAIDMICDAILKWLAPVLSFTSEEAWRLYRPDAEPSVHLTLFPEGLEKFRDETLANKWEIIRAIRRVVTGALEVERAAKNIGSSLEASPIFYLPEMYISHLFDVDWAEVCITSNAEVVVLKHGEDAPPDAFILEDDWNWGGGRESRRHQMRAVVENPPDRGRRRRLSRCVATRCTGAARMEGAGSDGLSPHLRPGIIAAFVVLALDQASKLWLLNVFDIAHRGAVKLTPFFDLVLAWNVGISFGWFQNESPAAQISLMVIKAVAVIVLASGWRGRGP